jgi:hypothetical protein
VGDGVVEGHFGCEPGQVEAGEDRYPEPGEAEVDPSEQPGGLCDPGGELVDVRGLARSLHEVGPADGEL